MSPEIHGISTIWFRKFARESRFSKKKSAKHGKSRGIRKIQGPQSLSNFRCANTLIVVNLPHISLITHPILLSIRQKLVLDINYVENRKSFYKFLLKWIEDQIQKDQFMVTWRNGSDNLPGFSKKALANTSAKTSCTPPQASSTIWFTSSAAC